MPHRSCRITAMRRRLALTLTAALTVTVALAGCGDDPPARADTIAGDEPAATSAPAEPVVAGGETLTKKQAKASLLTVKDLPTGWAKETKAEEEDGESKTEPARCAALFDSLDTGGDPVVQAEARFAQGFQLLEHSVTSFEDDVDGLVKDAADAFSKCSTFTAIEPDGSRVEAKMSALSFPNLGDRTLAVRMTGASDGVDVVLDIVMIAIGHNGVGILAGGLTPIPGAELEAIARKAVAKLPD
jgi:hypothetical protein